MEKNDDFPITVTITNIKQKESKITSQIIDKALSAEKEKAGFPQHTCFTIAYTYKPRYKFTLAQFFKVLVKTQKLQKLFVDTNEQRRNTILSIKSYDL